MSNSVKVRAVFPTPNAFGWYDEKRRYDGDEFTVSDPSLVSKVWMEVLEEPRKADAKPTYKSKSSD